MAQKQKTGGLKKGNRAKIKAEGRSHPISLYIRGKIDASQYFALTGQSTKK